MDLLLSSARTLLWSFSGTKSEGICHDYYLKTLKEFVKRGIVVETCEYCEVSSKRGCGNDECIVQCIYYSNTKVKGAELNDQLLTVEALGIVCKHSRFSVKIAR